jgi:hypothetical protein
MKLRPLAWAGLVLSVAVLAGLARDSGHQPLQPTWSAYIEPHQKFVGLSIHRSPNVDQPLERGYRLDFKVPKGPGNAGTEDASACVMFSGDELEPKPTSTGGHSATAMLEHLSLERHADFTLPVGTLYISTADSLPDRFIPRPWPVLITKYIGVGAEATEFIVRTGLGTAEKPVERVYLLKGSLVLAVLKTDGPPQRLKDTAQYAEYTVAEDGSASIKFLPLDDGEREYIETVKARAGIVLGGLCNGTSPSSSPAAPSSE